MARINVVTHETASAEQKALFDAIQSQFGIVPNFLKVTSINSPIQLRFRACKTVCLTLRTAMPV